MYCKIKHNITEGMQRFFQEIIKYCKTSGFAVFLQFCALFFELVMEYFFTFAFNLRG